MPRRSDSSRTAGHLPGPREHTDQSALSLLIPDLAYPPSSPPAEQELSPELPSLAYPEPFDSDFFPFTTATRIPADFPSRRWWAVEGMNADSPTYSSSSSSMSGNSRAIDFAAVTGLQMWLHDTATMAPYVVEGRRLSLRNPPLPHIADLDYAALSSVHANGFPGPVRDTLFNITRVLWSACMMWITTAPSSERYMALDGRVRFLFMRQLMFEHWLVRTNPLELKQNRLLNAFLAWLVDPIVSLRLYIVATMRRFHDHDPGRSEALAMAARNMHERDGHPMPDPDQVPLHEALYFDISYSPSQSLELITTSSLPSRQDTTRAATGRSTDSNLPESTPPQADSPRMLQGRFDSDPSHPNWRARSSRSATSPSEDESSEDDDEADDDEADDDEADDDEVDDDEDEDDEGEDEVEIGGEHEDEDEDVDQLEDDLDAGANSGDDSGRNSARSESKASLRRPHAPPRGRAVQRVVPSTSRSGSEGSDVRNVEETDERVRLGQRDKGKRPARRSLSTSTHPSRAVVMRTRSATRPASNVKGKQPAVLQSVSGRSLILIGPTPPHAPAGPAAFDQIRRPLPFTPPSSPQQAHSPPPPSKPKFFFKLTGDARCELCRQQNQELCFAETGSRHKSTPFVACDYCRSKKTKCVRLVTAGELVEDPTTETSETPAPGLQASEHSHPLADAVLHSRTVIRRQARPPRAALPEIAPALAATTTAQDSDIVAAELPGPSGSHRLPALLIASGASSEGTLVRLVAPPPTRSPAIQPLELSRAHGVGVSADDSAPMFSPVRNLLPYGDTPSRSPEISTMLMTPNLAELHISSAPRSPEDAALGIKRLRDEPPPPEQDATEHKRHRASEHPDLDTTEDEAGEEDQIDLMLLDPDVPSSDDTTQHRMSYWGVGPGPGDAEGSQAVGRRAVLQEAEDRASIGGTMTQSEFNRRVDGLEEAVSAALDILLGVQGELQVLKDTEVVPDDEAL